MPDYASNHTSRYVVTYSTLGTTHTMMFRAARSAATGSLGSFRTGVQNFLNAITAMRFTDWTVLGAVWYPTDSDISVPDVAPTVDAGTRVIPTDFGFARALTLGFVGRSSAGQRAGVFVFGALGPNQQLAGTQDYRYANSENTQTAAAITALGGTPNMVASDNLPVTWKPYANVNLNDYWVKRLRS